MKKAIIATVLSGLAGFSVADTFQDFNNNAYVDYNLVSPNQGSYANYSTWGVGGTFQSKNNVYGNAEASMGSGSYNGAGNPAFSTGNISLRGGYAFQFFNNDSNGFQAIPYAQFSAGNITAASTGGNMGYQTYGVGVIPEYRLMDSLLLGLDVGIGGTNYGASQINSGSSQQMYYNLTPTIQYDISKTVLLGVSYNYSNAFNSSNSATQYGNSVLTLKVGYLF